MTDFFPRLKNGKKVFFWTQRKFSSGSSLQGGFTGFNGSKRKVFFPFENPKGKFSFWPKESFLLLPRRNRNFSVSPGPKGKFSFPKESKRKVFFRVSQGVYKQCKMYSACILMFLMLVGVNSRTYYRSGILQPDGYFGAISSCSCIDWVYVDESDCRAWWGRSGILSSDPGDYDMNKKHCIWMSGTPAERTICLCKKTCLPGEYLVGNECVSCTGMIEAAYTDEIKLDIYDVPTYVPEKCVTKDELKTRYNELVCRL